MSEKLDMILSEVFQDFVKDHENEDVSGFLLKKAPEGVDLRLAADQILSRRKAKSKLPKWVKIEGLVFPPPLSLEQCSSLETADYKKTLLSGETIIDLTGGMGVDLLTLSENFENAVHVEMDEWLSEVFCFNAPYLTDKNVWGVHATAESFLNSFEGKATFFIDPARRDSHKNKVFLFRDCSPNVVDLLPDFQLRADKVLIKAAPMIDISMGMEELQYVSEVHVVSLNNECKEVLFLLDFEKGESPKICCVNIHKSGIDSFEFFQEEERNSASQFADAQTYIYEPNASIRKAGAFKLIGEKHHLKKLAVNTHLYTSDVLLEDFPGRVFEVIAELDKKSVKRTFVNQMANVISKNYPMSAEQIKRKFGLKDGGEQYLIGFRDRNDKPKLMEIKRL